MPIKNVTSPEMRQQKLDEQITIEGAAIRRLGRLARARIELAKEMGEVANLFPYMIMTDAADRATASGAELPGGSFFGLTELIEEAGRKIDSSDRQESQAGYDEAGSLRSGLREAAPDLYDLQSAFDSGAYYYTRSKTRGAGNFGEVNKAAQWDMQTNDELDIHNAASRHYGRNQDAYVRQAMREASEAGISVSPEPQIAEMVIPK